SWRGPPPRGDVHRLGGFDPAELGSWLQAAGFAVVRTRRTFGTAVSVLKELFMLAEARRVPGVGLALLPFLALAARLEWWWGGRRGNGVAIVARRMALAGRPRPSPLSSVGARG